MVCGVDYMDTVLIVVIITLVFSVTIGLIDMFIFRSSFGLNVINNVDALFGHNDNVIIEQSVGIHVRRGHNSHVGQISS